MSAEKFHFKQFALEQDKCAMKVGTDGVLLGAWAESSHAKTILDIGTGTGIIALMLAQRNSNAKIDAIEIDEPSCIQAKENVLNSKFKERIRIINSPLEKFSSGFFYDLIVCNPPYFSNSLKSKSIKRNLVRHGDFAGISSEILIKSALKLLKTDGKFCLILPNTEGEIFIKEAAKKNFFCNKLTRVFSKPNKKCFRLLMQFEKKKRNFSENYLTIETGEKPNDFSNEYKQLTKDFYLAF